MMLDVRRDRARVTDGNHALAASLVVIGAIALADLRAAGLLVAVLAPLLALSRRGNAVFRTSLVNVDESSPLADGLMRAGPVALVEIEGPMLFLSVPHIDRILADQQTCPRYLILDLRAVTAIDASALSALRDLLQQLASEDGEFLLVCAPGCPVSRAVQRSGLAARALGGTTCFRLERALERIATRHPETRPEQEPPAVERPRLYLVHSAGRRGD